MTKPYTPLAIANFFIKKYGQVNGIEHMKLQKLVYFAYGWWLAYSDDPLITEAPEVWKYGPVFDSLYKVLKNFGPTPIKEPVNPVFWDNYPTVPDSDQETIQLLDWIWRQYGHCSSFVLSDMTHKVGSPWEIEAKRNSYKVPYNHEIPDSLIKDYFSSLAQEQKASV